MPKVIDALAITTAVTGVASAPVQVGTGAIEGLTVEVAFAYGSGGTSGKVWLQTSMDGGATWWDIVNMTFTTASKVRLHNISALTAVATPYVETDGTLGDDTVKDGLLGTLYRTKLTTIGTYAGGTTLSVTIAPH